MTTITLKKDRNNKLNFYPTGPTEDEIAAAMMSAFSHSNGSDRPGYVFTAEGEVGFLKFLTAVIESLKKSTKSCKGILITPGRPSGGGGLDFALEAVEYEKNAATGKPEDYSFPTGTFFGKLASDFSLDFNNPTILHRQVVPISHETEKIFVDLGFLKTFCDEVHFDQLHVNFGRLPGTGQLTVILSRFLNNVIVDTDLSTAIGSYADDNDLLP